MAGGSDSDSGEGSTDPVLPSENVEYSVGSSETTAVEVLLAIEDGDPRGPEPEAVEASGSARAVWAIDPAGVAHLLPVEDVD